MGGSLRRRLRNDPQLLDPRDADGLIRLVRIQTEINRKSLTLHVQSPDKGMAIEGQSLPNLPGAFEPFSPPRGNRPSHPSVPT